MPQTPLNKKGGALKPIFKIWFYIVTSYLFLVVFLNITNSIAQIGWCNNYSCAPFPNSGYFLFLAMLILILLVVLFILKTYRKISITYIKERLKIILIVGILVAILFNVLPNKYSVHGLEGEGATYVGFGFPELHIKSGTKNFDYFSSRQTIEAFVQKCHENGGKILNYNPDLVNKNAGENQLFFMARNGNDVCEYKNNFSAWPMLTNTIFGLILGFYIGLITGRKKKIATIVKA